MPSFDAIRRADLPRMAWHFESRDGRRRLLAGADVECHGDGFFEGCWRDADIADLGRQADVFGSGMCVQSGEPLFVGASHTLEALYVYSDSRGHSVSNSLAFLVEAARISLPDDLQYAARMSTLVCGLGQYDRRVAAGDGWRVERVVFDNFTCDDNGVRTLHAKALDEPFTSFAEYRSRLTSILRDAFDHAASAARRTRYLPLGTCSSGYDSLACLIIARELGCREAVTIRSSRDEQSDSGAGYGAALGVTMREVERKSHASFDEFAEFAATGTGGEDVAMLFTAPHLEQRVLITGFHGDRVWDVAAMPNERMSRGDLSGASLQEFRLRAGFIHIPVPMILSRRHRTIRAISRSAEMSAYRTSSAYDRPIPRRLIEEAGIPRGAFANRKRMIGTLIFFSPGGLTTQPEPPAEDRLEAATWTLRMWIGRLVGRLLGRRGVRPIVGDWRIFEHAHPRNSRWFVAAVNAVRARYRSPAGGRA